MLQSMGSQRVRYDSATELIDAMSPISRSLITSAKLLLPYQVRYSQVPETSTSAPLWGPIFSLSQSGILIPSCVTLAKSIKFPKALIPLGQNAD